MRSKLLKSILIIFMAWNCQSLAQTCPAAVSPDSVTVVPKIVIISGTNRSGSNTSKVAEQVREIYEKRGAQATLLSITDSDVAAFLGENYFKTPQSFQEKFDNPVNASDSVIFVFPEYYGSYPGILGTLIDYMQVSYQGKPVAFIGLSKGILGAQKGAESLGTVLRHMKADIISEAQVNLPEIEKVMTDGRVSDKALVKRLEKSAESIIQRVKNKKQAQQQVNEMLEIVKNTESVLTFQLNSSLQVRGHLTEVRKDTSGRPFFMKWSGPTEMQNEGITIEGQGVERHRSGFSSPIGTIQTDKGAKSLSNMQSWEQLNSIGLVAGEKVTLKYTSGITVEGILQSATFTPDNRLQLLTFGKTTVTYGDEILYKPSWGPFDLAVGEHVDLIRR